MANGVSVSVCQLSVVCLLLVPMSFFLILWPHILGRWMINPVHDQPPPPNTCTHTPHPASEDQERQGTGGLVCFKLKRDLVRPL